MNLQDGHGEVDLLPEPKGTEALRTPRGPKDTELLEGSACIGLCKFEGPPRSLIRPTPVAVDGKTADTQRHCGPLVRSAARVGLRCG